MTMSNAGFIRILFGRSMETATLSPFDQSSSRAGADSRRQSRGTHAHGNGGSRRRRSGNPCRRPSAAGPDVRYFVTVVVAVAVLFAAFESRVVVWTVTVL